MNFVTKKDFEDAIAVVLAALENGQVVNGQTEDVMTAMNFLDRTDQYGYTCTAHQIKLVSPKEAAHRKIFAIREALQQRRSQTAASAKEIESLEQSEKKIAELIKTLKE